MFGAKHVAFISSSIILLPTSSLTTVNSKGVFGLEKFKIIKTVINNHFRYLMFDLHYR